MSSIHYPISHPVSTSFSPATRLPARTGQMLTIGSYTLWLKYKNWAQHGWSSHGNTSSPSITLCCSVCRFYFNFLNSASIYLFSAGLLSISFHWCIPARRKMSFQARLPAKRVDLAMKSAIGILIGLFVSDSSLM